MSQKVSQMDQGQGVRANLITAALVLFASKFGLPVSTTMSQLARLPAWAPAPARSTGPLAQRAVILDRHPCRWQRPLPGIWRISFKLGSKAYSQRNLVRHMFAGCNRFGSGLQACLVRQ